MITVEALLTQKEQAEAYLARFWPVLRPTETDVIALEALLRMTLEHGIAMGEWGSEEPTIRVHAAKEGA